MQEGLGIFGQEEFLTKDDFGRHRIRQSFVDDINGHPRGDAEIKRRVKKVKKGKESESVRVIKNNVFQEVELSSFRVLETGTHVHSEISGQYRDGFTFGEQLIELSDKKVDNHGNKDMTWCKAIREVQFSFQSKMNGQKVLFFRPGEDFLASKSGVRRVGGDEEFLHLYYKGIPKR